MEDNQQVHWDVNVADRQYGPGETIQLRGVFRSEADEAVKLRLHALLETKETEDFPVGIVPREVVVPPKDETDVILVEYTVTEEFPPGQYSVKVGLEGEKGAMAFKTVSFIVTGTKKPLALNVIFSRDREGRDPAKVFTQEDKTAYLRITSEVDVLQLSGFVVNPDEKETAVQFDGKVAVIPLTDLGAYTLRLEAEAEGFRTLKRNFIFTVIKEKPVFTDFRKLKEKTKD